MIPNTISPRAMRRIASRLIRRPVRRSTMSAIKPMISNSIPTRTPPARTAARVSITLGATARRRLARRVEILVVLRGRRRRLALVARAELARAIRSLDRARHLEERDLTDLHAAVERNRQVRDVGEFERQVALPARI